MNQALSRFWHAIEAVPDLAGIAAEWEWLLRDELPLVRTFLRPIARLAQSYRPPGKSCFHKVVRHGPDDYIGICPDGCEPEKLSKGDIIIHELDIAGLNRAVAEALGINPALEPMADVAKTLRIGRYTPYAGYRFPVYSTIAGEPEDFRHVVDALAAADAGAFILVAPTRGSLRRPSEEALKHRKAGFLAMSETFAAVDGGRLVVANGRSLEDLLADFRAANTPKPEDENGMVFFPTPAGARWDDLAIVFKDGHTVSASVGDVQRILNYTQMGMASGKNSNPTKQWDLLHTLALGNGRMIWQNSRPKPKDRTRKSLLATDLREFFRIEGDPFILAAGGGWSARFLVTAEEDVL